MTNRSREILNRALGAVKGISVSENLTRGETEVLESVVEVINNVLEYEAKQEDAR